MEGDVGYWWEGGREIEREREIERDRVKDREQATIMLLRLIVFSTCVPVSRGPVHTEIRNRKEHNQSSTVISGNDWI